MNRRDAKKDACRVVALLIENYFGVGQPHTECAENNPKHPDRADECPDCARTYAALKELRDELERRGAGWQPVSWTRSAHT